MSLVHSLTRPFWYCLFYLSCWIKYITKLFRILVYNFESKRNYESLFEQSITKLSKTNEHNLVNSYFDTKYWLQTKKDTNRGVQMVGAIALNPKSYVISISTSKFSYLHVVHTRTFKAFHLHVWNTTTSISSSK